jgi:hypothetical protein
MLNNHMSKKFMPDSDGHRAADALGYGLKFDRGRFILNEYELAQRVKGMILVN